MDIKVVIAGAPGAGKTTLARLIKGTLLAHGIEVEVKDDQDFSDRIAELQARCLKTMGERRVLVCVETKCVRRL